MKEKIEKGQKEKEKKKWTKKKIKNNKKVTSSSRTWDLQVRKIIFLPLRQPHLYNNTWLDIVYSCSFFFCPHRIFFLCYPLLLSRSAPVFTSHCDLWEIYCTIMGKSTVGYDSKYLRHNFPTSPNSNHACGLCIRNRYKILISLSRRWTILSPFQFLVHDSYPEQLPSNKSPNIFFTLLIIVAYIP